MALFTQRLLVGTIAAMGAHFGVAQWRRRRSHSTRIGRSQRTQTAAGSADRLKCSSAHVCCETALHLTADMADKTPKEPNNAPFATRIDPTKEGLSREQMYYIRQVELEQWKKKTQKLRTRNVVTGIAIGALVLGICILNVNTR